MSRGDGRRGDVEKIRVLLLIFINSHIEEDGGGGIDINGQRRYGKKKKKDGTLWTAPKVVLSSVPVH